jgi:hypothetical protein
VLKQTIAYEDFDGEKQSEDFYFNLTKAELIDMMMLSGYEDYGAYLTGLVKSNDRARVYTIFKDIILKSYGVRIDGKRFKKTPELAEEFTTTAAYDELMSRLFTDGDFALQFLLGILPQEVQAEAAASMDIVKPETKAKIAESPAPGLAVSDQELLKMDDVAFARLMERRQLLEGNYSPVPAAFLKKP